MSLEDEAFKKLEALGAGEFAHLNGSLILYLHGTQALLGSWGNRESLCLAGLYHAVYGTDAIEGQLASLEMRQAIADVIGPEAEALAYLYGACDRRAFYPRIATEHQLLFVDRFQRNEYPIAESTLKDFCELTFANELELAGESETFRDTYRSVLVKLLSRMKALVSETAFASFEKLLC